MSEASRSGVKVNARVHPTGGSSILAEMTGDAVGFFPISAWSATRWVTHWSERRPRTKYGGPSYGRRGGPPPPATAALPRSLSSYKYLQGVSSEFRLPITVLNPGACAVHRPWFAHLCDERWALSATRARQLMGLPAYDSALDSRDRTIVKFFLYSGARINTGCRLKVKDFHQDGDEATITLHEKGDKHRRIGLHFAAAQAIAE